MKFVKYLLVATLSTALLGCGHGFEGQYQLQGSSSDGFMSALAGMTGLKNVVIGSDYIETDGKRDEYEDIFVRTSGDQKYLVFKDKDSEQAWSIVDDNTLVIGNGIINITLERVQ